MTKKELFEAIRAKSTSNGFLSDVEVEVEFTESPKILFMRKSINLKDLTKDDLLYDEDGEADD